MNQRVFPGEELRVFAGQCHITLEGHGTTIFRQTREVWHQHVVGWRQHDQVFTTIVLVDADDIEQVHGKGDEVGIVILLFDAFSQKLCFLAAVGVNFQQAIAALFQLRFQRFMLFAAGFNQVVKTVGVFRRRQVVDQLTVNAVVDGTTGRAGVLECVQTFMEPANQHRLGGFFEERHVDLNIVRLTDTVQTADTLLQQVRVEWQIKHHQVAGELEVTAF